MGVSDLICVRCKVLGYLNIPTEELSFLFIHNLKINISLGILKLNNMVFIFYIKGKPGKVK